MEIPALDEPATSCSGRVEAARGDAASWPASATAPAARGASASGQRPYSLGAAQSGSPGAAPAEAGFLETAAPPLAPATIAIVEQAARVAARRAPSSAHVPSARSPGARRCVEARSRPEQQRSPEWSEAPRAIHRGKDHRSAPAPAAQPTHPERRRKTCGPPRPARRRSPGGSCARRPGLPASAGSAASGSTWPAVFPTRCRSRCSFRRMNTAAGLHGV